MVRVGDRVEIELEDGPARSRGRSQGRPRRAASAPIAPRPTGDDLLSAPGSEAPAESSWTPPVAASRPRSALIAGGVAAALGLVALGWSLGRGSADSGGSARQPADVAEATAPSTTERRVVPAATLPRARDTGPPATTTTTSIVEDVSIVELGRQLLPAPTGLELVGLTTDGDLIELDLDTGRYRRTDVTNRTLSTSMMADAALSAVGGVVYITSPNDGSTWLVRPGEGPVRAPGLLGDSGAYFGLGLLPSDEPGAFWLTRYVDPSGAQLTLVTPDGERAGVDVELGMLGGPIGPDGRGGVLVASAGGVYRVGRLGATRIATGNAVGWGANHVLIAECDDALVCGTVIVDIATGDRTAVAVDGVDLQPAYWYGNYPSVSPDGRGLLAWDARGPNPVFSYVDLAAGTATELSGGFGQWSAGWSTDGRFLLYLDDRELFVVDRPLATYLPVSEELPELTAFVLRPAGTVASAAEAIE
jgi:hypothetical protein